MRSAWISVTELLAWRDLQNGKERGAWVGWTPTPSDRGKGAREQGVRQAGHQPVRGLIVALAGW